MAGRSFKARSLMKPAAFIAVIFLLVFLSRVTVAYTPLPRGAVALPDAVKDKVVVSSIDGGVQTVYDESTGGDTAPQLVGTETWTPSSNTIIISPQVSTTGCETEFTTSLSVSFTTMNMLSVEEKGAVNVTIYNNANGLKLATYILPMDFKPGVATSATAHFDVSVTDDSNPAFLVKITFPSISDLSNGISEEQVPLFEYLLYQAGILAPSPTANTAG